VKSALKGRGLSIHDSAKSSAAAAAAVSDVLSFQAL
jgi:hypothetical protein